MKRLFFALWPDHKMRTQLAKLNQTLSDKHLRKVKPENLHITLVFLGNVDAKAEAAITQDAGKIRIPRFSLSFQQVEFWKKPQLLCLTSRQYDPPLLKLVDDLKSLVAGAGIKTEKRPYRPHVSLARKARHAVEINVEPVIWQAQSFCLLESCSTENGVSYRVLQSWSCKA